MLIGICGGLCTGKRSVVEYLVRKRGFTELCLDQPTVPPEIKPDPDAKDIKPDPEALESKLSLTSKVNGTNGAHSDSSLRFPDVEAMLEFVTKRWQSRWVISSIQSSETLDILSRRPFFLLVSIDAPISVRFQRFKARSGPNPLTLEKFIDLLDQQLYNCCAGLVSLIDRADVRLINGSSSLSALHKSLDSLDLVNEERVRPSWDQYFMQLSALAAQRSNCMKRRVGCVLVRDRRVISTGYNGTPRGIENCNKGGCARCNGGLGSGVGLMTCLCIHAEENALLEAGRERIREGATLYCDTCPCLTCSIKIAQVGISEVVYNQGYSMDSETAAIFKAAGVCLRQFSPPRKGLILAPEHDHPIWKFTQM